MPFHLRMRAVCSLETWRMSFSWAPSSSTHSMWPASMGYKVFILFLPLPPGRSRGDQAPVHVNWTPQATKAESPVGPEESRLPPVWTHPRAVLKPRLSARTQTPAFHKPKPQQVLRRWGSRQLRAELHLWAQCTFPPRFREVSSAFPDSQWESADTASLTGQALPRGWFYSKW